MFRELLHARFPFQSTLLFLAFLVAITPLTSFASISSAEAYSQFVISNRYTQSTSHTITIDSVTVRPDSTFQLALQVSDLTGGGISSFDIDLSYDASLITATGATLDGTLSGPDGAGMTLVANLDTPGTISLAAAGANAITGSGALVILTLQSLSTEGTASISFSSVTFNEGSLGVTSTDGAVTIEGIVIGDPSLNREVTAYDASLVLQHAVGNSTLTGEAHTAAEASGNGQVTAYDASLILQHATGMISCFPAEASCGASKHAGAVDAQLSWHTDLSGDAPTASLLIDDIRGSVQAVTIELDMQEDNILNLTSLAPKGWTLTSAQFNETTYRILLVGNTPLVTDSLITLTLSDATDALHASYQLNEEAFTPLNASDLDETPSAFALHQNYPNPFNPSTTIQYALPQESRVTLTIYNLLGREVTQLVDEVQGAGTHSISFDAGNLASGTYLYRIETPGYTATRQMLFLK